MKILRYFVGLVLFALGVVGLVLDYDGIRISHGGALHAINAGVELGLIFTGIVCLIPALAMEIAKDLPVFGKAITSALPGGSRSTDPPPPPPGGP